MPRSSPHLDRIAKDVPCHRRHGLKSMIDCRHGLFAGHVLNDTGMARDRRYKRGGFLKWPVLLLPYRMGRTGQNLLTMLLGRSKVDLASDPERFSDVKRGIGAAASS